MTSRTRNTHLDEYMCEKILRRLPAKTLVRFRCVCKQWNSLISSPSFIADWHDPSFTADDSPKSHLILFRLSQDFSSSAYCFYNPQQPHLAHHLSFSPVPNFKPQHSIQDPRRNLKVIDVVHGVVCLSHRGSRKSTFLTLLWNPSLHKYIEIPLPEDQLVVGFGFDVRTYDFKLVRDLTPDRQSPSSMEVYSTRERRWRRVETDHIAPFSLSCNHYRGCFQNGAIHWIGTTMELEEMEREELLLMFDCESEELKTMALPIELSGHDPLRVLLLFIAACNGKLSVLTSRVIGELGIQVDVWVMEEYGVSSSWRKLTPDQIDVVTIYDHRVSRLNVDDNPSCYVWNQIGLIDGPHQPYNGYAFDPSLLLMDGNSYTG